VLVVDTSVLLAAGDNADPDHAPCTRAIEGASPLLTTAFVMAETARLIGRQLGARAEAAFLRAVAAGEIGVEPITPVDARRIAELIETYGDLGLGGTDDRSSSPSGSRSRRSRRLVAVISAPHRHSHPPGRAACASRAQASDEFPAPNRSL
jgi:uncharacterized protein